MTKTSNAKTPTISSIPPRSPRRTNFVNHVHPNVPLTRKERTSPRYYTTGRNLSPTRPPRSQMSPSRPQLQPRSPRSNIYPSQVVPRQRRHTIGDKNSFVERYYHFSPDNSGNPLKPRPSSSRDPRTGDTFHLTPLPLPNSVRSDPSLLTAPHNKEIEDIVSYEEGRPVLAPLKFEQLSLSESIAEGDEMDIQEEEAVGLPNFKELVAKLN
eukprot:TRINITY_DN3472_c1_g3_i2.p1 TRINITY_DN3472_c1_g3~~TRINITY_DN3472_c1_g3_i2.p1  ORF type:complete len:211 (-),score=22.74 TRINITY_DN3472_c1_g3_i2:156-788(-)